MPPSPTYRTETDDDGQTVYHCCYCAEQGSEHHASDFEMFKLHMQQRHDGRLIQDTEASAKKPEEPPGQSGEHPDHPHGAPPGQSGEHPDHPHGEPPGQVDKPEEDDPHVENPITLPEVEHHEEPKPEEGA